MSHETKAGLLVSCAFLCMVGAVVYLKMNDATPATTDAGGELPPWPKPQSPEPAAKSDTAKAGAEPPATPGPAVVEPPRFERPRELQLTGASTPPAPLAPEPPAKSRPLGGGPPVGSPLGGGSPLLARDASPPLPDPPSPDPAPVVTGPRAGALVEPPPATPPVIEPPTPVAPPLGREVSAVTDARTGGTGPSDAKLPGAGIPVGPATPPPPDPPPPSFTPGAGSPPPVADAKPPSVASPPGPPLGGTPEPPLPSDFKQPSPPTPGGSPLTMPAPAGDAKTPSGVAGSVNLGAPETPAPPTIPSLRDTVPPNPRFAPPPSAPTTPEPPAAPAVPPVGTEPGSAGLTPLAPPVGTGPGSAGLTPAGTVPPLAAPPTVASPPIPVGGPAGAAPAPAVIRPPVYADPRVESFDEETYVCKPNDSFKSISQDKYMTDKYERALLMFNRAHPLAADGIRNEPALLRAGQPVYIPPLEILEKRYPALIPNMQPRPVTDGTPPQSGPAPSPSWASPAAAQTYTVRDKPETFYEIAQKVFGRAERWGAIWELNRQATNPNQPLPVGTVVRLPAK